MIEIILLLACCCFVFMIILAGYFLTLPKEDDECGGKDENGNYEIDEDLKCVLKSCATGYYKSGKECLVDNSGVVCVPTGTPDPQGAYLTTKIGGCELSSCETGFVVDGDDCTTPDPTAVVPPSEYKYVGDGECHNDSTKAGNFCRGNVECDYIGQQSNGCWHLLDSTGTGKGIGTYSKNILPITPVSTTYKFVGEGGCTGPNTYQDVGVTCGNTPGCDTIGVQSNGCWHLLDSTRTGKGIASYPKGIMSVE